jgi:hypothetical protein
MADIPTREPTPRTIAATRLGTNIVMDYGTEEAAQLAFEHLGSQDDRCAACLHTMAPALRRAMAIAVWKGVRSGLALRDVLVQLAPGTQL